MDGSTQHVVFKGSIYLILNATGGVGIPYRSKLASFSSTSYGEFEMLIVFSGLPGTGKTTIGKGLAAKLGAVYVRIDTIEQALRDSADFARDVGRTGYLIAYGLAAGNLGLGGTVVVDCVNPVVESRRAWSAISSRSGAPLVNIQVICSDMTEHRRRVESRQVDIPGLTPPSWQSVMNHDYEPWDTEPFTVDTALNSPAQALAAIADYLKRSDLFTPDQG